MDHKTGAELVNPYDNRRDKTEQVEEMFDSIAPAYDFMNNAMSFGLHRYWRNKAVKAAAELTVNPSKILDIATGTGDVAFELHRRFPKSQITGVDLSEKMLSIATKKLKRLDETEQTLILFEKGDCLGLRFDDNTFDLITVAYGVRNFEYLDQGLKEMARVLRQGGIVCIIELSEPEHNPAKGLYHFYSGKIIPRIGKRISGDSKAYTYLPESIAAAPQRYAMTARMTRAGFSCCTWKSLSLGAVTYYLGEKL